MARKKKLSDELVLTEAQPQAIEKKFMPEVDQLTVVDSPKAAENARPAAPLLFMVSTVADNITPWGTNVKQRDIDLRQFVVTEPVLSSAVYSTSVRNASFEWEIVSAEPEMPDPKNTRRAVTKLLLNSNRGAGWKNLMLRTCNDLYCLAGRTRIFLGGNRLGQTKSIAQIVKDHDTGPVISVDSKGALVEREVVSWNTTPLANRKWYWLSAKSASTHSGNGRGGIFLTEDHPMLTQRGWVQAKDITTKDKIATADPVPSKEQEEVIVGGLLGDLGISKLPKRSLFRLSHCLEQLEYLEFKKTLFKGFQWTGQNTNHSKTYKSVTVGVNSKASLGLNRWWESWYPDGKKVLNREDVITHFSPRMLAIWFMDDGCHQSSTTTAGNVCEHGILSTESFSFDDVTWLSEFLTSKGMDCKVEPVHKSRLYRLRFSSSGYKALSEYIGKYVIPIMRYKLPQTAPEYDPSVWEIEEACIYFDDIEVIEPKPYISGKGVCQTTYHIGVDETRNFIAGGLVSHNSQDNGAFWEIIRAEDSPTSPVLNLAHLDSGRCYRTGDPKIPVIYLDRFGVYHYMKWYQVITIEEFPSPIESLFGVQVCAVSRALRMAQILRDIEVYKLEKVSGRWARSIDLVGGISRAELEDAYKLATAEMDNMGLTRFNPRVIIPGIDPTNPISHETIELASLPDAFSFDEEMKWYISILAMAFGVDYQEFAPLPSGNLGSGQQSEILHMKTRGKGPAMIMGLFEHILNNSGLIPSTVKFQFLVHDSQAEESEANSRFLRGKDRALRVQSGELDVIAARQIAVDDGDLPDYLAAEMDKRGVETDGQNIPEEPTVADGSGGFPPAEEGGQNETANNIETGMESRNQRKQLPKGGMRGLPTKKLPKISDDEIEEERKSLGKFLLGDS